MPRAITEKQTRDQVVKALRELARELKRTPTIADWRQAFEAPSVPRIYRLFGSWTAALRAARLAVVHRGSVGWTREEIIAAAKEFYARNGRAPQPGDWRLAGTDHPGESGLRSHFKDWDALLTAAKIPVSARVPLPPGRPPQWESDRIIEKLADIIVERGVAPSSYEWRQMTGVPSVSTIERHFQTWNYAVELAADLIARREGRRQPTRRRVPSGKPSRPASAPKSATSTTARRQAAPKAQPRTRGSRMRSRT